jgi:ketosteroid isomerase-like protein
MNTTVEKSAIEKLIFSYQGAFNAEEILKTVACYEEDGILMPQGAPSAKGPEQLKATFGFLLKTFKINVEYVIDEVIVNGDYAYARTNSKVKTIVRASEKTIFEDNKELFVLHKLNDQWKISHYIFNNNKMK